MPLSHFLIVILKVVMVIFIMLNDIGLLSHFFIVILNVVILSVIILCVIMLHVIILSVAFSYHYSERSYAECHYTVLLY
jgi:hypothetical protein